MHLNFELVNLLGCALIGLDFAGSGAHFAEAPVIDSPSSPAMWARFGVIFEFIHASL